MNHWTAADMPSQSGRTAVVTGTGGLGFQDAFALARAGANVIIAGRSPAKGTAAVTHIRRSVPEAHVTFEVLDLASLDSITAFAERLDSSHGTDLLPNGAGAWSPPGLARRFLWFLFQPAAQGSLPTLFAATSAQAHGGDYFGPDSFGETRGFPTHANVPPQALDTRNAARLWNESERLTHSVFPHCRA